MNPGSTNAEGGLLESPFHYRDDRTKGIPEEVFAGLPAADLYASAGLQVMPFNTIFQLVAGRADDLDGRVRAQRLADRAPHNGGIIHDQHTGFGGEVHENWRNCSTLAVESCTAIIRSSSFAGVSPSVSVTPASARTA